MKKIEQFIADESNALPSSVIPSPKFLALSKPFLGAGIYYASLFAGFCAFSLFFETQLHLTDSYFKDMCGFYHRSFQNQRAYTDIFAYAKELLSRQVAVFSPVEKTRWIDRSQIRNTLQRLKNFESSRHNDPITFRNRNLRLNYKLVFESDICQALRR